MVAYLIPAEKITAETEVRKSRFICHLAHASQAIEAKRFIETINKQYLDATHNCWAFQTKNPGSTLSIGYNDDGEPHGTAGKPMLNVLCHSNVGEIVAVVSRYYGGTKLGTGGLARAYSASVKTALDNLPTKEKIDWAYANLVLPYSEQSAVENVFQETGVEIINSTFDDKVRVAIRFNKKAFAVINSKLGNLSQGKLRVHPQKSD